MNPQERPGQGAGSIEQMQDIFLNVAYNVASILAMPTEIWLRPWFGTRYFPPAVTLFATIFISIVAAFFTVAGSVTQMIPLVHLRGSEGMFGIADMAKLFFLANCVHGWRIWRRMVHPERELISTFEGPPLSIFHLLPKGNSFWFVRIVYEPALVFAVSTVLSNLFIIQASLGVYIQISAFCLAAKQYVAWYKQWQLQRQLLDAANIGPIIARMVDNKATDDDLAQVHMATLPKNLPPDIHKATVAHVARAYSVPKEEA